MRAVNLIPDDQRSGVSLGAGRSEGTAYAVLVLIGGLAVLAFLYGSARHQISSRTSEAASTSAEVAKVQSEVDALAPYASFITLREQRANAVAELVNARFDWAHGLHELGRVLPSGVWLTSIAGSITGAAAPVSTAPAASATASAAATVTSATPPGSVPTFSLTGCAPSQSEVALTLDRLRLIDGVVGVTLQASGSSTAGSVATVGCKTNFTVALTFEALPTSATVSAATATAGKASTSEAASTSTGAGAG